MIANSRWKCDVMREWLIARCLHSHLASGVCRKNGFSRRNLSDLCVSALNSHAKTAHRRDAENAENAQSSFFRQTPKGGTPNVSLFFARYHPVATARGLATNFNPPKRRLLCW